MALQNVEKIKSATDENGLKTLRVNEALSHTMSLTYTGLYFLSWPSYSGSGALPRSGLGVVCLTGLFFNFSDRIL